MLAYYGIVDPFYTTSIDIQVTVAKPKSFTTKNNGYANLEFVIKTPNTISVILGASQKVVAKTVWWSLPHIDQQLLGAPI